MKTREDLNRATLGFVASLSLSSALDDSGEQLGPTTTVDAFAAERGVFPPDRHHRRTIRVVQRGRSPGSGRGHRVIAGELGGLRLVTPRGATTRPTTDRVKESVFGALGSARLAGARVLDGYAGSGALAIEALSRGAAEAVLIDRDPRAVDAIRRNLASTKLVDRARVQRRGLGGFLQGHPPANPFDLVFLDPPYDLNGPDLARILELLAQPAWTTSEVGVVIERSGAAGPPSLPPGWQVAWERVYGDTLVVLVGPDADAPSA